MRTVKCVLVGDENVDKRELFIKYVALMNAEVESATEEIVSGTDRRTLHGEVNEAFENGDVDDDQNERDPQCESKIFTCILTLELSTTIRKREACLA